MEMQQQLSVNDVLLDGGNIEYTKVPIESNRSVYKHNEDLDLIFTKQPRILDCNSLKLVFKFVKGTDANLGFPYCVQDLFSCTSLRLNGNECLPNYRNDGRHLMTNFLRTALRGYQQTEQPVVGDFTKQKIDATTAQSYNIDAFKFQNQLMTSAQNGTASNFVYLDLPICDIVPELKNLGDGGMLDLSATQLQLTLKMSDNQLLQYRPIKGVGGETNNSDKANVAVQLEDMTIVQRTFKKNTQQPLMQSSVMETMIQYTEGCKTGIQDFRVSVPHKYLSAVVLFIQPKSKVGGTNNTTAYKYNPPNDDACFAHTIESVAIKMKDLYVEHDSKRYRQNSLPISAKDVASYLDAKMSVEIAFPQHQLNIPFTQWVQNRHAYIIPINPQGVVGSAKTDSGVVNVHLDYGDEFFTGTAVTFTDMEISAYFLVRQEIKGDRVER